MRLSDDRVIAPSLHARRVATATLLDLACGSKLLGIARRALGAELLAFQLVDTHAHLLAVGARGCAVELARRYALGLHRALGQLPPFEPTRVRPIVDRRHLVSTFWYIHRQQQHHRTAASLDASSALDILGLRARTDRLARSVSAHLPRFDLASFAIELGLATGPATGSLDQLAEAASAALGLPALTDRSDATVLARLGAVHAARPFHSSHAIADALGIGRSTERRLAATPAPPFLVHAVTKQWSLEPSQLGDGTAAASPAAPPL